MVFLGLSGVATIMCPVATSYPGLMTCAAFFGLATAPYGVLLPCIIVDILGVNLLTSGYAYILIFEALGTVSGAPVADMCKLYTHCCLV